MSELYYRKILNLLVRENQKILEVVELHFEGSCKTLCASPIRAGSQRVTDLTRTQWQGLELEIEYTFLMLRYTELLEDKDT